MGKERQNSTKPKSVFHYTDSAGLLGILKSKSLFATDYRYLNDTTEGGMIRDLILPIFEAEIAEITPKLIDRGLLKKLLYDQHGVAVHRLQAEGTYRAIIKALDITSPMFVLSFCRHTKIKTIRDGLLSQWRAYTGVAGFAIEFDEKRLDKLVLAEGKQFAYPVMKSDDVLYAKYKTLFDRKVYQGVAGEVIRQSFDPLDVSKITGRKALDPIVIEFCKVAPFLKHDGFQEEQEYRIVAARLRAKSITPGATQPEKKIEFRSRKRFDRALHRAIQRLEAFVAHYIRNCRSPSFAG